MPNSTGTEQPAKFPMVITAQGEDRRCGQERLLATVTQKTFECEALRRSG